MAEPNPPQQPETPRMVVPTPGGADAVVEHPAKLLRIASMVREMVEEIRQIPLDDAGRRRLTHVYDQTVKELEDVLSENLVSELRELAPPLTDPTSEAELRVAQAQLLGWLEGLFHGIQAALWAQHMQSQAALEEMRRRGLPSGIPGREGRSPEQRPDPPTPPGQYL